MGLQYAKPLMHGPNDQKTRLNNLLPGTISPPSYKDSVWAATTVPGTQDCKAPKSFGSLTYDFNTPNSVASYLATLQQFDAPHSFGEQGQSSSAATTNIENTNIEQQHDHDVEEPVILERRNPRRNRRPPPCGTSHRLGHWSIKCCDNGIKYV